MTTDQRVVMITGATAGLGLHLAEQLAPQGVTLLLHGRDPDRLDELCRRLRTGGATVHPYLADLSILDEVRDLGRRVVADQPRLDVLINNAGVGPGPEGAGRELSKDGHELRLAVGYLAPYLLTRILLPALRGSDAARVVNVGSAAQADIDHADLDMAGAYNGWVAYGRANLALASFTVDIAEELAPEGVTVNCVHPADLMPTALVRETGLAPQSTVQEGGDAVLSLALSTERASATGGYYAGLTASAPHDDVLDPGKRRALRESTERLLGQ